jgi:hypothetical protein
MKGTCHGFPIQLSKIDKVVIDITCWILPFCVYAEIADGKTGRACMMLSDLSCFNAVMTATTRGFMEATATG